MPSSDVYLSQSYKPGTTYPVSLKRRKRVWSNTVNYPSVSRDQLGINPYNDQNWDISQEVAEYRTRSGWGQPLSAPSYIGYDESSALTFTQDAFRVLEESMASDSWYANSLALKALGKISDSKVNLAVMYAEKAKTSDLILDSAKRIYQAYRSFRRGDVVGVTRNLNISPRRLHKSWLEYKYGWMPILMDVKGAAEFFAQRSFPRPARFTVVATTEDSKSLDDVVDYSKSGYPSGTFDYRTRRISRSYKVKAVCELNNPHLSTMQQLGLTNPALIAWELVPFSFVFDWFISVGDYLTGLTALNGVTVRRAMFSWEKDGTVSNRYVRPEGSTSAAYEGKMSCKFRTYNRGSFDLNPFTLTPPIKSSLNWQQLTSGLALLRGKTRVW